MVADWPTVRGCTRPDSVIPVTKKVSSEIIMFLSTATYVPTASTSLESDPKSLVTVQLYVPATPLGSLTVSTLEYVDEDLSVIV